MNKTKKLIAEEVREMLKDNSIIDTAKKFNLDVRTVAHIVWADTKMFTAKCYGLFGKSNNTNHLALIVEDPLENIYQ